MNKTVFIEFSKPRNSYTNMSLTKLGHTDYDIHQIHTFKDLNDDKGLSYVAVEYFKPPTPEQVEDIRGKVDKFLEVTDVSTISPHLSLVFEMAKNKEPGTKRKFWFDHATYVSPGLANKE